jgi:AcrR family transcriptional regulator
MSSKVKEQRVAAGWRGEPLPRGRHKLAAATVRASQRGRLIRAMLETVAERGYEATAVPEVIARARVARNAFYQFFTDKTDCFVAACDEQAQDLLATVIAFAGESSWITAVRLGTRAYLRWWADRPAFARAYFLGLPSAGERAIAQRSRAYAPFRQMFAELARRARAEQPELPPLPRLIPRVLVLAITELIAEEVRAGRTAQLTDLDEEIALLAIKLLADDQTARQATASPRLRGRLGGA